MNMHMPRIPTLNSRNVGALGDGFANAGKILADYGKSKINKEMEDNQFAINTAYKDNDASLKADTFMEKKRHNGIIETEALKPKLGFIAGSNGNYMTTNNKTGEIKDTGVGSFMDPYKNMSSDEKLGANMYGKGTHKYNNYMNNIVAKKQMVTTRDAYGIPTHSYPIGNQKIQHEAVINKNIQPRQMEVTPAQNKVLLDNQVKKMKIDEDVKKTQDDNISIEHSVDNANRALEQIDGLINNDNLKYATGALSATGLIPGTPMKDIHAEIDTIKAGSFMTAIKAMKGMGSLSDTEGSKVAESIANLDTSQSTEQIRKQLGYIRSVFENGKKHAEQKLKNRNVITPVVSREDAEALLMQTLGN